MNTPETHDVAYPDWDDLTPDEKRRMIADHHPLADAADDSSSASRQFFIDEGRYLTNAEVFEFEENQAGRTVDGVKDPTDLVRQADMMNGEPVSGDAWEPSGDPGQDTPERDYGDVFEEYMEAWQIQNSRAYVVAVSLRSAITEGLKVPEFLRTELDRFAKAERTAAELGEAVRTHPTAKAHAEALQIEGDN